MSAYLRTSIAILIVAFIAATVAVGGVFGQFSCDGPILVSNLVTTKDTETRRGTRAHSHAVACDCAGHGRIRASRPVAVRHVGRRGGVDHVDFGDSPKFTNLRHVDGY